MSVVRSVARVVVRTPIVVRSGAFDDGRTWSVREVEVLDSDSNKSSLRVSDGIEFGVGEYDLLCDFHLRGSQKAGQCVVVEARPVSPKAVPPGVPSASDVK